MGRHALLQGIFLTQGSNPGLSHCRQILYHLSGVGVGGRRQRDRIHVYRQLVPAAVRQKPAQHCKAIILQSKKIFKQMAFKGPGPYTHSFTSTSQQCSTVRILGLAIFLERLREALRRPRPQRELKAQFSSTPSCALLPTPAASPQRIMSAKQESRLISGGRNLLL